MARCSNDANENRCNGVSDYCFCSNFGGVIDNLPPGWSQGEPSITGYHTNCAEAIGDDSGTDTCNITLKNGWAILVVAGTWHGSSDSEKVVLPSLQQREAWGGLASITIPVSWHVTPSDEVGYALKVYIIGTPGTTHNY